MSLNLKSFFSRLLGQRPKDGALAVVPPVNPHVFPIRAEFERVDRAKFLLPETGDEYLRGKKESERVEKELRRKIAAMGTAPVTSSNDPIVAEMATRAHRNKKAGLDRELRALAEKLEALERKLCQEERELILRDGATVTSEASRPARKYMGFGMVYAERRVIRFAGECFLAKVVRHDLTKPTGRRLNWSQCGGPGMVDEKSPTGEFSLWEVEWMTNSPDQFRDEELAAARAAAAK